MKILKNRKLPLVFIAVFGLCFGTTLTTLMDIKIKLAEKSGYIDALLEMPLETLPTVKVNQPRI